MKTFFEPKGLSPSRSQDHHIPLLSRSVPPNIRPYHTLMCRKKRLKNWSMGCLQLVASKRALVIFLHQFTFEEKKHELANVCGLLGTEQQHNQG